MANDINAFANEMKKKQDEAEQQKRQQENVALANG